MPPAEVRRRIKQFEVIKIAASAKIHTLTEALGEVQRWDIRYNPEKEVMVGFLEDYIKKEKELKVEVQAQIDNLEGQLESEEEIMEAE